MMTLTLPDGTKITLPADGSVMFTLPRPPPRTGPTPGGDETYTRRALAISQESLKGSPSSPLHSVGLTEEVHVDAAQDATKLP